MIIPRIPTAAGKSLNNMGNPLQVHRFTWFSKITLGIAEGASGIQMKKDVEVAIIPPLELIVNKILHFYRTLNFTRYLTSENIIRRHSQAYSCGHVPSLTDQERFSFALHPC